MVFQRSLESNSTYIKGDENPMDNFIYDDEVDHLISSIKFKVQENLRIFKSEDLVVQSTIDSFKQELDE